MQQELVTTADTTATPPHVALRVRIATLGVKQYLIAERVGMSESVLSRILSGRKAADEDTVARINTAIDDIAKAA